LISLGTPTTSWLMLFSWGWLLRSRVCQLFTAHVGAGPLSPRAGGATDNFQPHGHLGYSFAGTR
jgi:hypothetical protein